MSMEMGFSSYAVGWTVSAAGGDHAAVADDLVALAVELGYGRLQIADNCPLHRLTVEQRVELHRRAGRANVAIEVGARGLTSHNLATYIPLAAELESPFLRLVIDEPGYEPDYESIVRLLRSSVGALEEISRHGRCRTATLEHWVPPEPELARTLQKEREWCELSTSALRRLLASSPSR